MELKRFYTLSIQYMRIFLMRNFPNECEKFFSVIRDSVEVQNENSYNNKKKKKKKE